MKKSGFFLAILAAISFWSFGQESGLPCATDEVMEELQKNNPDLYREYELSKNKVVHDFNSGDPQINRTSATTIIIPVVVHLIHDNGAGDMPDSQVQAAIDQLNIDYQKKNADTSLIRNIFKPIAGGMNVEFRLAKIDPNGNCTNGIVRVNSPVTGGIGGGGDPLRQVSPTWNSGSRKYYNIWVSRAILAAGGGNVLGFSYYPFNGGSNIHGTTILASRMGTITTGSRVLTHETGHAWGLPHTFDQGCSSNCQFSGDGICDTPDQPNSVFACNTGMDGCPNDHQGGSTGNPNPYSSSPPDMIENYMGYNQGGSRCHIMFSKGQIDYMESSISNVGFMGVMASPSNNVATGTDDAYYFSAPACSPQADFSYSQDVICVNGDVSFQDRSYGASKDTTWTWNWSFPGGIPNSSSLENPVITYSSPGTYSVTMTVSNSAGTDTRTRTSLIEVKPAGIAATGIEYFNNPQFPNNFSNPALNWSITQTPISGFKWERTTTAFYSSPASLWLNQAQIPKRNENYLTSPAYDLSAFSDSVFLQFAFAHAPSSNGGNDQLRILVTDDCEKRWDMVKIDLSPTLYTNGGAIENNFIPSGPNDWEVRTIDLSKYAGKASVKIRFFARSQGNNNFWLDDVALFHKVLSRLERISSIDFIELYPNPTEGLVHVGFELPLASQVSFSISDRIGNEVYHASEFLKAGTFRKGLDLQEIGLSSGIYLLSISTDSGRIIKKIVIQ